jgi:hypothetical protein
MSDAKARRAAVQVLWRRAFPRASASVAPPELPSRKSFQAQRAAGRKLDYYSLLDLHAAVAPAQRLGVERYIKAVCGVHPYHFLAQGERVLSLNHLLRRPRNFFFSQEHAAVYVAPSHSEFGPADFTDARGNAYRSEPLYPDEVLLVKLRRSTAKHPPALDSENPWGLPLPGERLELRDAAGAAAGAVTVVTAVFDTQTAMVPRKTGVLTFVGRLPPPAGARRKRAREPV